MPGDVAAINRGEAIRRGEQYLVNGRRYVMEATGRLYPVDGVGLRPLSRAAYKALGVYNTFGMSARAEGILDAMKVGENERIPARAAWQAGHPE